MSHAFKVGDRVICINAASNLAFGTVLVPGSEVANFLVEGAVYTLRWIGIIPSGNLNVGDVGVRLQGVQRLDIASDDPPFRADRFRPLVDTDATRTMFRAMVSPEALRAFRADEATPRREPVTTPERRP